MIWLSLLKTLSMNFLVKNSMKYTHEAWRGDFVDHYFGYLERGEWVKVSWIKYLWLKINKYTVRKQQP